MSANTDDPAALLPPSMLTSKPRSADVASSEPGIARGRASEMRVAPRHLPPSRFARELGLVIALWQRDMIHLVREKSRWIGIIAQPLIFWALLGTGLGGLGSPVEETSYLGWFFPGILAMVVLFTAVFATMSVIDDRQHGFLQQVMVVPSTRAALVVGKLAGVVTTAALQVLLCLPFAPLAGISLVAINPVVLALALILGCAAIASLNFVLAWLVDSTAAYHGIMAIFLLPAWVLSGAMFPVGEGAPMWMQVLAAVNPMAYLVDALRHALGGGLAVGTHSSVTASLAVLAGLTLAGVSLAAWIVARRTQRGVG